VDIKEKIFKRLSKKKSVFLVGPANSGKSRFAVNELLPFLEERGLHVFYAADCDHLFKTILQKKSEAVIIDEVETMHDKEFLELKNKSEKPYYSTAYLEKIKKWFDKLRKIKIPCVYIITRNNDEDVKNFIASVKTADWDCRTMESIEFGKGRLTK